jgi:hypothetical protein
MESEQGQPLAAKTPAIKWSAPTVCAACGHAFTAKPAHICRSFALEPALWRDRLVNLVNQRPAYLCLLLVAVWYLTACIAFPNLDSYGDMVEAYVFTPFWELGTFKHPPLMGWVARAWFSVMPRTVAAFYLLSSLCVLTGMLGVLRLASFFIPRRQHALMVLALGFTLPFSALSFKFNANSILLPIWPWLVVMFVRSVRREHWGYAIALGMLAALGMLGKYYTGVLLSAMLLAAVMTRSGRHWLRTPAPYLALATFSVLLLPHASWVVAHGSATVRYVGHKADHSVDWKHLASFMISPLSYCGIAWGGILAIAFRGSFRQRVLASWRLRSGDDLLFWLMLTPLLITALFALTGYVKLALHWAIPLAYIQPLFWLSRSNAWDAGRARAVLRALPALCGGLLALAIVYVFVQNLTGNPCHYRDDPGVVRAMQQAQPDGKPLAWIGGSWPEVAIVPFFGEAAVRAIPGTPDHLPAGVTPLAAWRAEAGALLCRMGDSACQQQAAQWMRSHGQNASPTLVSAERHGWLFLRHVPTRYLVYWYQPG